MQLAPPNFKAPRRNATKTGTGNRGTGETGRWGNEGPGEAHTASEKRALGSRPRPCEFHLVDGRVLKVYPSVTTEWDGRITYARSTEVMLELFASQRAKGIAEKFSSKVNRAPGPSELAPLHSLFLCFAFAELAASLSGGLRGSKYLPLLLSFCAYYLRASVCTYRVGLWTLCLVPGAGVHVAYIPPCEVVSPGRDSGVRGRTG